MALTAGDNDAVMRWMAQSVNAEFQKLGYPPILTEQGLCTSSLVKNAASLLSLVRTMSKQSTPPGLWRLLWPRRPAAADVAASSQSAAQAAALMANEAAVAMVTREMPPLLQRMRDGNDLPAVGVGDAVGEEFEEAEGEGAGEFSSQWRQFARAVLQCVRDRELLRRTNDRLEQAHQHSAQADAATATLAKNEEEQDEDEAGTLAVCRSPASRATCAAPSSSARQRRQPRVSELEAQLRRLKLELQRRDRDVTSVRAKLEKEKELLVRRCRLGVGKLPPVSSESAASRRSQSRTRLQQQLAAKEQQLASVSAGVADFLRRASDALGEELSVETQPDGVGDRVDSFARDACNLVLRQLRQRLAPATTDPDSRQLLCVRDRVVRRLRQRQQA